MFDFRIAVPLHDIMLWSGLLLVALELVFSEFYFIWIGLGLLSTYFTQVLVPFSPIQNVIIMFLWISVYIYIGMQFKKKHKSDENASKHLNQPKDNIVGARAIFFQEDYQQGTKQGYIEHHGTMWQATLTELMHSDEHQKAYDVEIIEFTDMKAVVRLIKG